jgi:flavin reductase (DIM6/NTAB) family NADH-FMN oxidoreductase RutF
MLAIAIQDINASYELIQKTREYVLAVPGTSMLEETRFCGTASARDFDKARELKLDLLTSEKVAVPSLEKAIANIEMVKEHSIKVGDHILVVGKAVNFRVSINQNELPLLSVGPDTRGYRILAQKGIHRIGTVAA